MLGDIKLNLPNVEKIQAEQKQVQEKHDQLLRETQSAFTDFVDTQEEIEKLTQKKSSLKDQLQSQMIDLLRNLKNMNQSDLCWEIASDIYWMHPELKGIIRKAYHSALKQNLEPRSISVDINCHACKKTKEIQVNSYAGIKSCYTCQECTDKQSARFRKVFIDYETQKKETEEAIRILRIMPYQEYLQTEHWKRTRLIALKKSGFRCQTCNASGLLDVHHRTYERRGCERNSDLVVLCRDCHELFHENRELNRE